MPDYKLGFLGSYISAVEFVGKMPSLAIESIKLETLPDDKGGEKDRWVARFKGHRRGWIINLTNAQIMEQLFRSRNTEDWIGRIVTLRAVKVLYKGKPTDGFEVAGSPELRAPMNVTVALPRKKERIVTLRPTDTGARTAPAADPDFDAPQDRQPGEDDA